MLLGQWRAYIDRWIGQITGDESGEEFGKSCRQERLFAREHFIQCPPAGAPKCQSFQILEALRRTNVRLIGPGDVEDFVLFEVVPAERELDVLGVDDRPDLDLVDSRFLMQLAGHRKIGGLAWVDATSRDLPPRWLRRIVRVDGIDQEDPSGPIEQNHTGCLSAKSPSHRRTVGRRLATEPTNCHHSAMSAPDPLAGVRVLDFSRVVAGPFATRMLSDLGADVVKVEPPEGDLTRFWGRKVAGLSGFYTQQNAGKRNICVDMKAAGARELLLDMATKADMIVENYRPGVMKRLGLSYDDFKAVNPSVIMLSISGFGQEGADSGRAAFAPILHAESGLLGRQGRFDNAKPSDPMLSIADTNASLHGLVALLAALHLRFATGEGQHIDMAMLNSMTVTDDYAHNVLDDEPIERLGGTVWSTKHGDVLASGNAKAQWFQLSKAGLVTDGLPKDATIAEKTETRHRVLESFFSDFDVRSDLIAALDQANVAWADVRQPEEVFETDVAAERRLSVEVDDRDGGTRRVVQSPYHFSNARSEVRGGPPFRGEHNSSVLAEWLDMDPDATEQLLGSGVLLAEDQP